MERKGKERKERKGMEQKRMEGTRKGNTKFVEYCGEGAVRGVDEYK